MVSPGRARPTIRTVCSGRASAGERSVIATARPIVGGEPRRAPAALRHVASGSWPVFVTSASLPLLVARRVARGSAMRASAASQYARGT